MSDNDVINLVLKLEKKLSEYKHDSLQQNEKIIKILNRLTTIDMTLEVLQITHIGKTVNRLKKVKGLIGEKSKALIVKWKQLLSSDDDRDKRLTKYKNDITSSSYNADIILPSSVDRLPEQSSPSSMINQRKRKGGGATIEDGEAISIGLSKKSRTQVYSGRSAGLKYVPSLFDMCMNILIDNIDAIDEVSGIPFFILEPVLSKCTPTQLMRIEELNEHLVEDSDGLWQKHTLKEFRHVTPRDGQTWRELYLEKLADREEKMKSITSSIKARQQAREEPVRKAAVLNSLPRRPPMGGGFSSRSIFSSPNTGGSSQSNLMKQTIKMAKHRQGMLSFRRK